MLQYQPKLYQMCPSAYGVDATSIRIGKSLTSLGASLVSLVAFFALTIKQSAFFFPSEWKCACQVQRFFFTLQFFRIKLNFLVGGGGGGGRGITEKYRKEEQIVGGNTTRGTISLRANPHGQIEVEHQIHSHTQVGFEPGHTG